MTIVFDEPCIICGEPILSTQCFTICAGGDEKPEVFHVECSKLKEAEAGGDEIPDE